MAKKYLLLSGSFLFGLFVLLSLLVDKNKLRQFDFNMTVRVQDNLSRRFDDFFSWFSVIGHFEVLLIVLLVILVLARKVIWGFVTFFLFGMFHIIEIIGKTIVENLPPPQFLLRTKDLADFPQFHVRAEYSYPSGHSGRTIFLSVILAWFIWHSKKLPKPVKYALLASIVVFDVIMLLSRVYLGEHWTSDVIGGSLLAASFALLSLPFLSFKLRGSHKK